MIRADSGHAVVIPTDVTVEGALQHLAQETIRQLGRIDILVNNAGVGFHGSIADSSRADVEAVFSLNVLAAAEAIRAVVPTMRVQGSGMIINISSVAGRIVVPRIGYYSATKFALTVIGDALRMEEAHRGIKVMNVFPGTTQSDFSKNRLGYPGPGSPISVCRRYRRRRWLGGLPMPSCGTGRTSMSPSSRIASASGSTMSRPGRSGPCCAAGLVVTPAKHSAALETGRTRLPA